VKAVVLERPIFQFLLAVVTVFDLSILVCRLFSLSMLQSFSIAPVSIACRFQDLGNLRIDLTRSPFVKTNCLLCQVMIKLCFMISSAAFPIKNTTQMTKNDGSTSAYEIAKRFAPSKIFNPIPHTPLEFAQSMNWARASRRILFEPKP